MLEQANIVSRYVTRYCLTQGILFVEGVIDGGYFYYKPRGHICNVSCFKSQYHETMEAAIAHAETMRNKQVKALERKIAALQAMTFTPAAIIRIK